MVDPIKLLVADNDRLSRFGIRKYLSPLAYRIVSETGNWQETVERASEIKPNVVIMEHSLPGLNDALNPSGLGKFCQDNRVLFYSFQTEKPPVSKVMNLGATGYLSKREELHELGLAINQVSRGYLYLPKQYREGFFETIESRNRVLSERETEILELIANGKTSKEIGSHLGTSQRTVEKQRERLMKKLDIHSLAGLTKYAIRVGLVSEDELASFKREGY